MLRHLARVLATLENTGTAPLPISSFGFFGGNTSSFSETNNRGSCLDVGASCSIAVTCTLAAVGSLSANLGNGADNHQNDLRLSAGILFKLRR
jgi:hypothetical protein